jgi:hypothetical protein
VAVSTIDYSNIDSSGWNTLYTLLSLKTNISDPRDFTGTSGRRFVYDIDPLESGMSFDLMPYIVIEPGSIDSQKRTVDGKHTWMYWKHRIIVRQQRSGSSNFSVDTGRTDTFSISNNLFSYFNNATNKETLKGYGMDEVRLKKTSFDFIIVDQKYIYNAVFELTYRRKVMTSV